MLARSLDGSRGRRGPVGRWQPCDAREMSNLHLGNLETLRGSRAKKAAAWSSPTIFSAFGSHLIVAAQPRGDRAEMAGVHRLHVAEDVGDGQPALADAAVEVVLVALERLALVEADQVVAVRTCPCPTSLRSACR